MLRGLGRAEIEGIVAERGEVDIGCDFRGQHHRFDSVAAGELFTPVRDQPPGSSIVH